MMAIDHLRCPICGATVKWSCGTGEHATGYADCQDGRRVSRRHPDVRRSPCTWSGTPLVRGEHGQVLVPLPVKLATEGIRRVERKTATRFALLRFLVQGGRQPTLDEFTRGAQGALHRLSDLRAVAIHADGRVEITRYGRHLVTGWMGA